MLRVRIYLRLKIRPSTLIVGREYNLVLCKRNLVLNVGRGCLSRSVEENKMAMVPRRVVANIKNEQVIGVEELFIPVIKASDDPLSATVQTFECTYLIVACHLPVRPCMVVFRVFVDDGIDERQLARAISELINDDLTMVPDLIALGLFACNVVDIVELGAQVGVDRKQRILSVLPRTWSISPLPGDCRLKYSPYGIMSRVHVDNVGCQFKYAFRLLLGAHDRAKVVHRFSVYESKEE